jgi:y4mF family transcriptional regulator
MIMRSGPREHAPPSETVVEEAKALGLQVRGARRKQGLKQEDLAFAANVSPRTVFAIEQGKPTVRFDMLTRVLAAVGLRLSAQPRDRVWLPDGEQQ